ncbi:cell wall shape-determining protein, partial [Salmonella enterica subsp. enterica serovar Heidelberg str. 622737-12]
AKIAVPLMVARFINRDVCPPSLKIPPSPWY